jgi:hypothetical protein
MRSECDRGLNQVWCACAAVPSCDFVSIILFEFVVSDGLRLREEHDHVRLVCVRACMYISVLMEFSYVCVCVCSRRMGWSVDEDSHSTFE